MRKIKISDTIGVALALVLVVGALLVSIFEISKISIKLIEISLYDYTFSIPSLERGEIFGVIVYAFVFIKLMPFINDPTEPMKKRTQYDCIQTRKILLKFIQKKTIQKRFWGGIILGFIQIFLAYHYEFLNKSLETSFVKMIVYTHIILLIMVYILEVRPRGDLNGIEKNHRISYIEYFLFFIKKFMGSVFGMMCAFACISGKFFFLIIIGICVVLILGIPYSALAMYSRKKHYS